MKKLSLIILGVLSLFILTGCSTYKAYTYNVETGDSVSVKLITSNNYDISSGIPFSITQNGNVKCNGTFITLDGYNQYLNVVNNDPSSNIIENNSKDNLKYLFYSYNNSEWNYIIKINNSNTGILLGSNVSTDSAKDCFDRLEFNVE